MKITMDENMMEKLIKSLLVLDDKEEFFFHNITGRLTIKFKGNKYNVRKKILTWLSVSERLHQMEVKSDD